MKKACFLLTLLLTSQIMLCYVAFSESTGKKIDTPSLKPLNEKGLTRTISKGGMDDMFGNVPLQKGLITYYSANNQNMMITNEDLVNQFGSKNHKLLLKTLKDYLNGQNKNVITINKNDSRGLAGLFDDCIDYTCTIKGKISGIKYPGMDKVVAVYTFDTQDPPAASVNVRIFASRGKDYVMLVRDTGLTVCSQEDSKCSALSNCFKKNGVTPKCETCSINAINTDDKVKEIVKKAAEDIINKYKIK